MGTENLIQIVIVDDHAMLRKGLAVFLLSYSDLKLVGEAANGEEALVVVAEKRPDIVLMDLMMPIMDGVTATRLIRRDYPETQVIALTSFGEEALIKGVLEAGAISYLLKKVSADDLATTIRAAKSGFSTLAPEVTEILARSGQQPDDGFQSLTTREREVLAFMVKGMGNNEIAAQLMVSLSTTKSHVSSILGKLGLTSRAEAIAKVLEHNLDPGAFYIK
ncbi:MAG TPA: response regulator transcription factor [Aggregatilineales bacterium]|nr:response regulator transcription factor [Aggregatilineales bacterium]